MPDITSNLVAHWKFDDVSGTSAADSVNGYNLTLTNTPTWTTGQILGALNFASASSEYGRTSASALRSALNNETSFTISFWVKASSATSAAIYIAEGFSGTGELIIYPCENSSGTARCRVWRGGNDIVGPASHAFGAWAHIVYVVRSSTDRELYVNGVSRGTASAPLSLGGSITHVDVGGAADYGQFFNGDMDDVRIYTRALSAHDVIALYYHPLKTAIYDETGYYEFPLAGKDNVHWKMWAPGANGGPDPGDGGGGGGGYAEGTYAPVLDETMLGIDIQAPGPTAHDVKVVCGDGEALGSGMWVDSGQQGGPGQGGQGGTMVIDDHNWSTFDAQGGDGSVNGGAGAAAGPDGDGADADDENGGIGTSGAGSGGDYGMNGKPPGGAGGGEGGLGAHGRIIMLWEAVTPAFNPAWARGSNVVLGAGA